MPGKLISLFDDRLRTPGNLVSGPTQTIESLGGAEDPEALLRKIRSFEEVRLKVDYSNFENFVFFNSALDYFNITGEKILNEYPSDGSDEELQLYLDALDDYQRYTVDVWPKSVGHLSFKPNSNGFAYVKIDDIGTEDGVSKTGLFSPGTGSFSIEMWVTPPPVLTGSSDSMWLFSKMTASADIDGFQDGFFSYYIGSQLRFAFFSASSFSQVTVRPQPGVPTYLCFTVDRTSSPTIIRTFSGSTGKFPVLVLAASVTSSITGPVSIGSSPFLIGSGTWGAFEPPPVSGGTAIVPLTGAVDDMRFWTKPLGLADITSSFNTRISAQDGLLGLWRFNETGSLPDGQRQLVRDASGHKLNGTVVGYYPAIRVSGSIIPFDAPDLVLSLDCPAVASYVAEQQESGSDHDVDSDNIITRLFPEQFFILEELSNPQAAILKNFLYVLARHYDRIKVSTDQFVNVLKSSYGRFDQTPDALLADAARFFGWEFNGNFLSADAVQYILGKGILQNTDSNRAVETKLFEIKNEFWKRTLVNLMHLYKTKGTRESVNALLRIYGVNGNFVRLKEHGSKAEAGIGTYRIAAEKSVPTLAFGSGTSTYTNHVDSAVYTGVVRTLETRVLFPTSTTANLTASLLTGSIWALNSTDLSAPPLRRLFFTKPSVSSLTGSLVYTGSEGRLVLADAPIFDGNWFNVAVLRDEQSGSLRIQVRGADDEGELTTFLTASMPVQLDTQSQSVRLSLGSIASTGSAMWMQEVRSWEKCLEPGELDDHALNFQSYGVQEPETVGTLSLHWRLNENDTASAGGLLQDDFYDFSNNAVTGSGFGFTPSVNPSKKFLFDYGYIASPEYGWNEEKIRDFSSSTVPLQSSFQDDPLVSLEFNLVDALNEDISQIVSSLDSFNESVGMPANRYRDDYVDLLSLRKSYFKKLRGSLNFTRFADFLEFFDRTFIDMVRKLIPARANFVGDEFVVESHMLERPKFQWNYRRRDDEVVLEGRIRVYIRG